MKVMSFKMSKLKYVSSGVYGAYYKVKGKSFGIKILEQGFGECYESISSLKKSDFWNYTLKEFNRLVKARKITTRVPKPIGMAIIEDGDDDILMCGYVMSHVEGTTVDGSKDYDVDDMDRLAYKIEAKGLILHDNHGENAIVSNKGIVFIDADRFRFKREKKK